MKKLIVLLIVLLSTSNTWAGLFKGPFFPTGTTWTEAWISTGEVKDEMPATTFEVGTDTLINDTIYKRILVNGTESGKWLREENQHVWLRRDDFPKEIMLYDFGWWNDNTYKYSKTNIRQYIEKGELKADTFYIDKREGVYLETMRDDDMYIQFEYYDYDAVQMIRGIGMVAEPYKDCCILGCVLPDDMEPSTKQCQLLSFTRDGKLIYDYKKQFSHYDTFTRGTPTEGVDIWFNVEWEGIVKEDYCRKDSVNNGNIYISAHYNKQRNYTGNDKMSPMNIGSYNAGDYTIVLTAVDDAGRMPDVVHQFPLKVKQSSFDVPRGIIYTSGKGEKSRQIDYQSPVNETDLTVTLEDDSLHICGWLIYKISDHFCYYEIHGDSIHLETLEKIWGPIAIIGGWQLYSVDFKIGPYTEDHCTIHVSDCVGATDYSRNNTLTFDFTSAQYPEKEETVSPSYDLQGRPAKEVQKGILIRNGKKIIIR